tara:strand:- start:67 stop:186 length:120 start_codon:yes stop_codon:yes gene_type:complete
MTGRIDSSSAGSPGELGVFAGGENHVTFAAKPAQLLYDY